MGTWCLVKDDPTRLAMSGWSVEIDDWAPTRAHPIISARGDRQFEASVLDIGYCTAQSRRQIEQPIDRRPAGRPSHYFWLVVEARISVLNVDGVYVQIYLPRAKVETRQDRLALAVSRSKGEIANTV